MRQEGAPRQPDVTYAVGGGRMMPVMTITDEEYLEAVQKMRPALIKAAEANCYAPDDAEDAVQDAILYCFKNLGKYDREKASLKTWVTEAVIDRALNTNYHHSRQSALIKDRPEFPDDEENTGDTRRAQAKPRPPKELGYDPNPDLRISVQQAIAKLPDQERSVAVAVLLEGSTAPEYAKEKGIPLRTVERRIERAKASLRELLKEWRD